MHQVFERIFVIQQHIANNAVLNVIGEQRDNLRILRHKIGTFRHQVAAKEHARFAVDRTVRQCHHHFIALYKRVPDARRKGCRNRKANRHIIHLIHR